MDCAFPLNSLNLYQKDFYGFYLLFKAGLHFSIHNNKLQCSSFFCTTNKFWDFVVQKIFFGYVRNLELPLPLVRNRTHLAWPLPSPTLGERIMWKTPKSVSQRFRNRCLCWSVGVSLECLCWSLCCLFFDKVAGLMLCNFMKKVLQHRSFPVSNAKFLRTYPVADSVSLIKAAIGIASNTMRDGFYKQSL